MVNLVEGLQWHSVYPAVPLQLEWVTLFLQFTACCTVLPSTAEHTSSSSTSGSVSLRTSGRICIAGRRCLLRPNSSGFGPSRATTVLQSTLSTCTGSVCVHISSSGSLYNWQVSHMIVVTTSHDSHVMIFPISSCRIDPSNWSKECLKLYCNSLQYILLFVCKVKHLKWFLCDNDCVPLCQVLYLWWCHWLPRLV